MAARTSQFWKELEVGTTVLLGNGLYHPLYTIYVYIMVLAELKNNNRKLGKVLSKRIYEYLYDDDTK